MTDRSLIEWTDATWNPIVGCTIVSPGCTNCYAMQMAARIEAMSAPRGKSTHYSGTTRKANGTPVWTGKLSLAPDQILTAPLRWKRPRMIFVNSMGDLFHEQVPDDWIDRVFAIMALAPQHTFQVLTKRSERMRDYMQAFNARRADSLGRKVLELGYEGPLEALSWPPPNVWLGISAERQQEANTRIPHLLATPAAIRFISAEPLLGPVDFYVTSAAMPDQGHPWRNGPILQGIDWVIVGGESGPRARPMHPEWVRLLRDQCAASDTAFFFKQWGSWKPICQMPEAEYSKLYRPNFKAKEGEDQDTITELYGNTCTVPTRCLRIDGDHVDMHSPRAFLQGTSPMTAFMVGKKASGRTLDGCEHNEMPQPREVPAL